MDRKGWNDYGTSAISFNIIKDFGGRLSVRNHPDGGAEFTVELVQAEQPAGVAAE